MRVNVRYYVIISVVFYGEDYNILNRFFNKEGNLSFFIQWKILYNKYGVSKERLNELINYFWILLLRYM